MKKITIFQRKQNPFQLLVVAFLLGVSLTDCNKVQPNYTYEYNNPGGKLAGPAWQFIDQTDSFSLMKQAVTLANLQSYYSRTDTSTYIIPRNSAWRAWLKSKNYTDITVVPVDTLQRVLRYHIVKAKVLFSDPALLQSDVPIAYNTESGQTMYLSHNSSYQGLINEGTRKVWTIITSNLQPTNGVIHVTADVVYLSL